MAAKDKKFAIGDIVKWTTNHGSWNFHDHYGIVTAVTSKGGVTAQFIDRQLRPHGADTKFRAGKDGRVNCEHASELEIARLKWLSKRPRVPNAGMRFSLGANNATPPIGAFLNEDALTTPEALRTTAAGLLTLAEWWEKQPTAESLASATETDH